MGTQACFRDLKVISKEVLDQHLGPEAGSSQEMSDQEFSSDQGATGQKPLVGTPAGMEESAADSLDYYAESDDF